MTDSMLDTCVKCGLVRRQHLPYGPVLHITVTRPPEPLDRDPVAMKDDALDVVWDAVKAALDAGCGTDEVMAVATNAAREWHLEANDRTDEYERSKREV